MTAHTVTLRYRLGIAARIAAALGGGYGVAAMLAIALAWALPMERIEAGTVATLAAIVAMPLAAMGCFWARSAARAWTGILISAALFAGIALAAGWRP